MTLLVLHRLPCQRACLTQSEPSGKLLRKDLLKGQLLWMR